MSLFKKQATPFGLLFRGLKHLGNLVVRLFVLATMLAWAQHSAYAGGNTDWTSVIADDEANLLENFSVQKNQPVVYYRFTTATQPASWLWLVGGDVYEICLDPNSGAEAQTGNDTEVKILVGNADGTPSLVNSRIILGITLNGIASTGGVSNDCIYEFEPGVKGAYILADPQVAPLANDAYITVTLIRKGV